ncbi:MAG: methyltransferase domain-containing protein [Agriterribacter sp.]
MSTQTKSRTGAPSTSEAFDKIYNSTFTHWVWSDTRIPKELKELVINEQPASSLELGCGQGRFSAYMATQGIAAMGVDFSSVAIQQAKNRVKNELLKPHFLTADVTNLYMLDGLYDVSFDIGCFHCLEKEKQYKYVTEVHRLLDEDGMHLIWALDHSPADIQLNPEYIAETFAPYFELVNAKFSRRRIIASHWYWLKKK